MNTSRKKEYPDSAPLFYRRKKWSANGLIRLAGYIFGMIVTAVMYTGSEAGTYYRYFILLFGSWMGFGLLDKLLSEIVITPTKVIYRNFYNLYQSREILTNAVHGYRIRVDRSTDEDGDETIRLFASLWSDQNKRLLEFELYDESHFVDCMQAYQITRLT